VALDEPDRRAYPPPPQGRSGPAETSSQSRLRFTLVDWLFAAAMVQTILFNPDLGAQGSLTLYLSGLTWPVVGVAALIKWMSGKDKWMLGAVHALFAAVLLVFSLLLVHLWVRGFPPEAVAGLLRLTYVAVGAIAALVVYRNIDRHIDLALVALAATDLRLLYRMLGGPIGLAYRLDPIGLGGFNVFAAFSAFLFVLRISMWILRKDRPSPLVITAMGICALTIMFTFSRSGFLALAGGIALAATLKAHDRRRNWMAIGSIILLVASLPFVLGDTVTTRISTISLSAASGRQQIWAMAWEGFLRQPIIGNGFSSFLMYSEYVFMDGRNYTSSAHNLLLQLLYELGILGTAAVLLAVWLVLRRCWNPVILPVLAALVIDAMFSNFPQVVQVSWILGIVAAAGLHYRARAQEQQPASRTSPGSVSS
jgi:O-antigen ligase